MATLSTPLHRPPQSFLVIETEKARSLLEREVSVYYKNSDASFAEVKTTVGEIFKRCQQTLAAEFSSTKLTIRGSSVAHLFSKEPVADVDFHCVVDLTHLPPDERVRRGFDIKWAVLRGVGQIISETLPRDAEGKLINFPLDLILFKEESNFLAFKTSAPFNVHTVRFGSFPMEFTLFSVIKPVCESERNYDFNSGSLELSIDESGALKVGSSSPEIMLTLDELSRRELKCESPKELSRKSMCRYFAKLVVSGYHDRDPSLLLELLENIKERNKSKSEEEIAKDILKEISFHFKEKGINPSAAFLSIWMTRAETPFLKLISTFAKEELKESLAADSIPEMNALGTLLAKGKKAESAWLLLLQAKKCRKVVHRGEECLQLELPAFPLFTEHKTDQSIFMTIPILGIKTFSESTLPQVFSQLKQTESFIECYDDETKATLQEIFTETLVKPSLYPVLAAALQRFGIENNAHFSSLFMEWFEGLSDVQREQIPFSVLQLGLQHVSDDLTCKFSSMLSVVRLLNKYVGSEKFCEFEGSLAKRPITAFLVNLLKFEKFDSFSAEDKAQVVALAKARVDDLFKKDALAIKDMQSLDGGILFKRTLNILHILYVKKEVTFPMAARGSKICLDAGFVANCLKFLQTIAIQESTLTHAHLLEIYNKLSGEQPLELCKFLKENARWLKDKIDCVSLSRSIVENLSKSKDSPELQEMFLDVVDTYFSKEQKDSFFKGVFQSAARAEPGFFELLDAVKKKWSLTTSDFSWIEEMDGDQLRLLSRQSDFSAKFGVDLEFTIAVCDQALSLGHFDLAIQGSLLLAKSFPSASLNILEDFLEMAPDDKSTLQLSLKVTTKLIELQPELIRVKLFMNVVLETLDRLANYFTHGESASPEAIDAEFTETIRNLHKAAVLHTLEHPCWRLVWKHLATMGKNTPIYEWVNISDLNRRISDIDPRGNISNLLHSFTIDVNSLYEVIKSVSRLKEAKALPDDYKHLIFQLLSHSRKALTDKPAKVDEETDKVAVIFLNALLEGVFSKRGISPDDYESLDLALSSLIFCVNFGSKTTQFNILMMLNALRDSDDSLLSAYIRSSDQPELILLSCVERAIERNNLSDLKFLKMLYKKWFVTETSSGDKTQHYTSITLYDIDVVMERCNLWQKFLVETFKNPASADILTDESTEVEALDFYAEYLSNILMSQSIAASQMNELASRSAALDADFAFGARKMAKDQERALAQALEFIDFLTRKKLLVSIEPTSHLVASAKYLSQEQCAIFSNRYLFLSAEILSSLLKKPWKEENSKAVLHVLNLCGILLAYSEPEGSKDKVIDRKLVTRVLELTRSAIVNPKMAEEESNNSLLPLSFLEGCLSKDDAMAYLQEWADSIIERKNSVTFKELTLFTLLALRCDPRVSHIVGKGVNAKKFADKLFINEKFFSSAKTIKTFIEVLEIGFERFATEMSSESTDPTAVEMNVFAIYSMFASYMIKGIRSQKSRADYVKLEAQFVDCIAKCLVHPRSKFTLDVVKLIHMFLIRKASVTNTFCLRDRPKATQHEDIKTFYLLIKTLMSLSIEEFHVFTSIAESLKEVYESQRLMINKGLSKEQVRELEMFISLPKPRSFVKFDAAAKTITCAGDDLGELLSCFGLVKEDLGDVVKAVAGWENKHSMSSMHGKTLSAAAAAAKLTVDE